MKCPKCGELFRVVETRTPDSHPDTQAGRAFRSAQKLVGWYTTDWAMRRRECFSCDTEAVTVEVSLEDLIEMFRSDECQQAAEMKIGASSNNSASTGGRPKTGSSAAS